MHLLNSALVTLFLVAIVVANLSVYHFGAIALPFTAFFLIPFDLVVRDVLHEKWKQSSQLFFRMLLLIVGGGLLSAVINYQAIMVALASCLAFTVSSTVNGVVFHVIYSKGRFVRMNISNLLAAITDSLIFPLVAFGVLNWSIVGSQAASKFIGGLVFTSLFIYLKWRYNNEYGKDPISR